jgi:hypothetical protein
MNADSKKAINRPTKEGQLESGIKDKCGTRQALGRAVIQSVIAPGGTDKIEDTECLCAWQGRTQSVAAPSSSRSQGNGRFSTARLKEVQVGQGSEAPRRRRMIRAS